MMTYLITDLVQLQIHAPQTRVEELTDALLCYPADLVFSTQLWRDYPLDPQALSAKEQVLGYQNVQIYLMMLEFNQVQPLLDYLAEQFGHSRLSYRVLPILQQGMI
jgi:hypothetical protein